MTAPAQPCDRGSWNQMLSGGVVMRETHNGANDIANEDMILHNRRAIIWSVAVAVALFAKNPDQTYGTGPQGLLDVSGESVAFADGLPFETGSTPEQVTQDIEAAASKCVGNARTRRCEASG